MTAQELTRKMLADKNAHEDLSMRWLGQNMTMWRCQWIDLLYELRSDSETAERVRRMLAA